MNKHFTVTTYIINDEKVLLLPHKKIGKWLPPGGHLEINELPHEGALREVLEETGIEVALIPHEKIWINAWNAKSIPTPHLTLLEEIPAHGSTPAHQHIDLIYLAYPIRGTLIGEARWFTIDEITELKKELEIFGETQETAVYLLSNWKTLQTAPRQKKIACTRP